MSGAGRVHRDALYAPAAIVVIAAAVLRSLGAFGYLLQVDAVFGPHAGAVSWSSYAPVSGTTWVLQQVIGGAATGKVYVGAAVVACGLAPLLLWRRHPWWPAPVLAAALGCLNPWVYARIVEGQWGVAVAAAGLVAWLAAFGALQRAPAFGTSALLALVGILTVAFSASMAGPLILLALGAVTSARPWRDPLRLRWTAAALGITVLLETYAVIPFAFGLSSQSYAYVSGIGRADFVTFRAAADPHYGTIPALLGLYGEWAERTDRFPVAAHAYAWWPAAAAIIIALALIGAVVRRDRRWLLVVGLLGVAASASTATGWGLDAVVALDRGIPLLGAWRDTQKWDALWLVALVALMPEGAYAVWRWTARSRRSVVRDIRWCVPVVAAAAILFPAGIVEMRSTSGIVTPVTYPADWAQAAEYLRDTVPAGAPVVVLPWHLYVPLAFTGRLTANPAVVYFPGNLVVPENPELPDAPPPSAADDPIGHVALDPDAPPCALVGVLRSKGIRWAIVEDAQGAAETLRSLFGCGFRLREGGVDRIAVLEDAQTAG